MQNAIDYHRGVLLRSMPLNISNGFNALHKYTQQTALLYDQWQREQATLIEKSYKSGNIESVWSLYGEMRMKDPLQSILLNSTFISCVAFFETQFKLICKILVTDRYNLDGTKGKSSLQIFYNFISKKIGIDLSAKDKLFHSHIVHNQIRNKIIHEQATIQSKLDLVKEIRKLNNISTEKLDEGYYEIKIKDCNFIYDYIEIAKEYLNFVNEQALKKVAPSDVISPMTFLPHK